MKKAVKRFLSLLSLIPLLCLFGCTGENTGSFTEGKGSVTEDSVTGLTETVLRKITSEEISGLKVRNSFSWEDFREFEGEDIGSGLYVMKYETEDGGYLTVSGPDPEQAPRFITYYHADGKEEIIR